MKPKIISLSGSARNGKTTSCEMLEEMLAHRGKRCLRMSYGDYVKEIARKYYGWDGKKDEAGRTLLQQLGTEKVRNRYPAFWVEHIVRLVEYVLCDDFDYILIDDARFPDEVYKWDVNGYDIVTILVKRPGFDNGLTEEQKNHISETAMTGFEFDYHVRVEGLANLYNALWEIAMGVDV